MNYDFYNILAVAGDSYFNYTLVFILSAILNCKKPCHFYIMQSDWTDEHKKECRDFIAEHQGNTVEYVDIDKNAFASFPTWKGHHEVYYAFLVHKLPDSVEKVMCIEPDILIRKDLEKFYSMDLEDNYLCCPVHPMFTTKKRSVYENIETKGGQYPNYFYGGSWLINVKKFKDERIDEKYILDNAVNKAGYSFFGTCEGIITYLFFDKIKVYPFYKYNLIMAYFRQYKELRSIYEQFNADERKQMLNEVFHEDEDFDEQEYAAVVHYAGLTCPKPWMTLVKDDIIICNQDFGIYKDEVVPFYAEWWDMAKKLPQHYYEELVSQAYKFIANRLVYLAPMEKKSFMQIVQ